MPKDLPLEITDLGQIDPTDIHNPELHKLIPYLFSDPRHTSRYFFANTPYTFNYKGKREYKFTLSQPIVRRQRNSDPTCFRIELPCDEVKGEGNFGSVNLISRTLKMDQSGYLSPSSHHRRVIKNIHHRSNLRFNPVEHTREIAKINKESIHTRIVPGLHGKPAIHAENSSHIIMRCADGEELAKLLNKKRSPPGKLTLMQCINTSIECARALEGIHALGIIHRDVKTENFMVHLPTNSVTLLDVGLSKNRGETNTNEFVGTDGLLSPEQLFGLLTDESTDIFQLGITLADIWKIAVKNPYRLKHLATLTASSSSHVLKDCEFDSTYFNREYRFPYSLSRRLLQLLKDMTRGEKDNRLPLSAVLVHLEEIRTLLKLHQMEAHQHCHYETTLLSACNCGLNARNDYRAALSSNKPLAELAAIIESHLATLNDDPILLNAFTDALGVRVLDGSTCKAEIHERLASVQAKYQQLKKLFLTEIELTSLFKSFAKPLSHGESSYERELNRIITKETRHPHVGFDGIHGLNTQWQHAHERLKSERAMHIHNSIFFTGKNYDEALDYANEAISNVKRLTHFIQEMQQSLACNIATHPCLKDVVELFISTEESNNQFLNCLVTLYNYDSLSINLDILQTIYSNYTNLLHSHLHHPLSLLDRLKPLQATSSSTSQETITSNLNDYLRRQLYLHMSESIGCYIHPVKRYERDVIANCKKMEALLSLLDTHTHLSDHKLRTKIQDYLKHSRSLPRHRHSFHKTHSSPFTACVLNAISNYKHAHTTLKKRAL